MISKLGQFQDPLIDAQIGEIVSSQFANYKEVTVTFTAVSTTTKVDVGFLADRFIIIDQTADMRIWRMSSDSRYMYLQASRAGSVTLKVWKSDQISTADAVGTAGTGAGSGDVVGPASAVNNNFVSFDGTTGKLIKDSGSKTADFAIASKGVTNGDSHDHVGGDGAQINHTGLTNIGTNTHPQIDTHIAATGTSVHGLGTMSTQAADGVAITGGSIIGITSFRTSDPYVIVDGLVGDGTTNDYTAIQNAINSLPAKGGEVILPVPTVGYSIETMLSLGNGSTSAISTKRGITFRGVSGRGSGDWETVKEAPVRLIWNGVSGGTMMEVKGPISGVQLEGIMFDCNSIADTGLKVTHAFGSRFQNVMVEKYTGTAVILTAYSNPTGCSNGANQNTWNNCHAFDPIGTSANGMLIGESSVGASPHLNVAQNVFINCTAAGVDLATSYGLMLRYCDDLTFIQCAYNIGSTGKSLHVYATTDSVYFPYACTFINCDIWASTIAITGTWTPNAGFAFLPMPSGEDLQWPASQSYMYGLSGLQILFNINKIMLKTYTNIGLENGNVWFDGTHIYCRIGGVSKQLDNA